MADKEAPPRPTASGADRISALPDGVRELVLSYLPAHEAVRTTVLARSWLNLWMRSPALRITGRGSVAKFIQFMEQLVRLRLGGPVSRRQPNGDPSAPPASLDSWHLDFGKSDFDNEVNLVDMKIVFIKDLKNAHAFKKLKALVLTDWFVASDFSALIWFLHHSPVLEKLTLQISKVHKIGKVKEGRRKLPEQSFASNNLKIVEIKCHGVDKTVIDILKILAAFGVPLERINIQCSSTGSGCVNFKCTSLSSK